MKRLVLVSAFAAMAVTGLLAQDRLKLMPGYDNFTKMQPQLTGTVTPGSISGAQFSADGKTLSYTASGKSFTLDLATGKATESSPAAAAAGAAGAGGRGGRAGGAPPAAGRGGGLHFTFQILHSQIFFPC